MTPKKEKFIIAIDGPAGSGKSTIAKRIARKLKLFYIDTGAMYRALALKAKRCNLTPADHDALVKLAKTTRIELDYSGMRDELKVFLDGEDVSEEIRRPSVTAFVSPIAKIKKVRTLMVRLQRRLADGKKAILEGRDITTVVFPEAQKKFYLDADIKERTRRRFLELKEKKIDVTLEDVEKDLTGRDKIDTTRKHAPLVRSPEALYIDTTALSIEEVVEKLSVEIER